MSKAKSEPGSLTPQDLDLLAKPFDEKTIGIKVNAFNRERTKVMLVPYVQHTDVYTRLEKVDPAWSSEVTHSFHATVGNPGKESVVHYVTVALTVKGVTRTNTGEGEDPKGATSDAHKRAAMLFGVGRYLYDVEGVWLFYDEQKDKYKKYTYDDYCRAVKSGQSELPVGTEPKANAGSPSVASSTPVPGDFDYHPPQGRDAIKAEIGKAAVKLKLDPKRLGEWAKESFNKPTATMTDAELLRFLEELQGELGRQGILT